MSDRLSDLAVYPNGQVGLSGDLLRLYRRLDRVFADQADARGAVDHLFPPILPASELAKIDYLASFPHLATFPVALAPDDENLGRFVAGTGVGGAIAMTRLAPIHDVLTPAICYHFYIRYQGTELDAPLYLTTRGSCFRREESYTPLERLWSFSMREIVCIGSLDEVTTFLGEQRLAVSDLVQRIGLPSDWKTATDPFFRPAQNPKHLAQRLDPVKSELVFEDRLAIASVNLHRNYFGEAFGIRRHGEAAFSGCVAFGIERWIAAILATFGADPDRWPTELSE